MTVEPYYLDAVQKIFVRRYPAFWIEYEGHVNEDVMREAFVILFTRNPILKSTIRIDGTEYLLETHRDHQPEFVRVTGNEAELRRELRSRPHYTVSLCRLINVEGERRGYIALQVNHAFFDGPSLTAILRELWQIYVDLNSGADVSDRTERKLPLQPSKFMKSIWSEYDLARLGALAEDSEYGIPDKVEVSKGESPEERHVVLDRGASAALFSAARSAELSVHAIVCGAALVALRGGEDPYVPTRMECQSQVDIRGWVKPNIGPVDTGLVNFVSRVVIEVQSGAEVSVVGREIKDRLDADISTRLNRGESTLSCDTEMPPVERRFTQFVLNAGRIAPYPEAKEARIVDFRIVPEETIHSSVVPTPIPSLHTYSYGGRLSTTLRFPKLMFAYDRVEEIAQNYILNLDRFKRD